MRGSARCRLFECGSCKRASKPVIHAAVESNVERHAVPARDGWTLDVLDIRPTGQAVGIVVAGHAMMVDRRTLYRPGRPCLVTTLVDAGFRVLVPDQRGHGESGPVPSQGGDWSYDDLVYDTPIYVELAQRLAPDLPVVLLGHSLFGHTALAYLGQNPETAVAAVVGMAINIWNPRWDTNLRRSLLKRMIALVSAPMVHRLGYFPARRLRIGPCDEAAEYWRGFIGWIASDRWDSRAGVDYHRGLSRVSCPLLHVLSRGDRLAAHPDEASLFTAPMSDRRTVVRVGDPDCPVEVGDFAPNHMELVTDGRSQPVWEFVARWIRDLCLDTTSSPT